MQGPAGRQGSSVKGFIMQLAELIFLAVGLSMDAFAVSITKGLQIKKMRFRYAVIPGIWFGVFQALMPVIGFLLGSTFCGLIENIDHWIAAVILGLIGGNMIREAVTEKEENEGEAKTGKDEGPDMGFVTMLLLAVATSIDALAIGLSFAFLKVDIVPAVTCIGLITCGLSIAGVYVGHAFGSRFKKGAAILGGGILIAIGVKILLEHLGILVF